jgi:hypothetical protein
VIVCRVCGHEETIGAIMRLAGPEGEDPAVVRARIRESEETQRLSNRMLLSAVTFAIYAVEGLPGHVGGSSSSGDEVRSVTVVHGERDRASGASVHVTTARDGCWHSDDVTLARAALASWLYAGLEDWAGGSDAAFVLTLRANERARKRAAAGAPAMVREIVVDGVPRRFTYVTTASSWAAAARCDSLIITVTATGTEVDSIRLRYVSDPVTTLT